MTAIVENSNYNELVKLVRTDSTTIGKFGKTILSPLGRIRRINRLDIQTAIEYKRYLNEKNNETI